MSKIKKFSTRARNARNRNISELRISAVEALQIAYEIEDMIKAHDKQVCALKQEIHILREEKNSHTITEVNLVGKSF